jgi:hypothetical protein
MGLPWAPAKLKESAASVPEGDGLARASACARAAAASTSRGVGTSVTARNRSANGRCGAGRRRDGRPSAGKRPRPRPNMPRRNGRAASGSSLRHKPRGSRRLRRRVVTQQKIFFAAGVRSAGVPRAAPEFGPQSGVLLQPGLPPGRSQRAGPGTQVAISRDFGRPKETRLRVSGGTIGGGASGTGSGDCRIVAGASGMMACGGAPVVTYRVVADG